MFMKRNSSQFLVNSELHHISTRQPANFHQPSVNMANYQKGVYHLGGKVFNALPFDIKNLILRNLKWLKNFYMKNLFIPWMNISIFRNIHFTFGYTSTNLYYNLFVYNLKVLNTICNALKFCSVTILKLLLRMPLFLLHFSILTNLYYTETLNIVLNFVIL
jgi:hypothetical protein